MAIMTRLLSSLLAPLAALLIAPSGLMAHYAFAQQHDEQGAARKQMQAGKVLSLREIERMILPRMKDMQYLGPAYDPVAMAYRLKFIKDGKVVFVDVDARTGRILARSK